MPVPDPAALASALRALAADRARVWELQQAAYARADERFRPSHVVAPLDATLRKAPELTAVPVS